MDINLETAIGRYVFNDVAYRVPADIDDEELRIFVYFQVDVTAVIDADWISVDNIRVYPALDYLTIADANDDSGVS